MKTQKISIIIPIYNSEAFLGECLDSVCAQTFSDFEVICVDDGSCDNSSKVVEKYLSDKRFSLLSKENGGQSSARNLGLSKALGEYVYFLDSDDVLENNALEVLVKTAEKYKADIVMFSAKTIYESKNLKSKHEHEEDYFVRTGNFNKAVSGKEMLNFFAGENKFCVCPPLNFYKRSFLKDNALTYYEGIYHEDELFFAESMIAATTVVSIENKLYVRRFHENSTVTSKKTVKHFKGLFISFAKVISTYLSFAEDEQKKYEGLFKYSEYLLLLTKLCYQDMPSSEREKIKSILNDGYKLMYEAMFNGGCFDTPMLGTISDIQNSMSFKIGRFITGGLKRFTKIIGRLSS